MGWARLWSMHRPAPQPIRLTGALVRALVVVGLGFLGLVALIYHIY